MPKPSKKINTEGCETTGQRYYRKSSVKQQGVLEIYKFKDKNAVSNTGEKANILGTFLSSVYTKEPEWTWILDDDEKPSITKELKLSEIKANKSPAADTPACGERDGWCICKPILSDISALNQARQNTDGVETSKRKR